MQACRVISNQVQVSLLDPRAQAHVLPLCKARNLSLLGYGPLAGGFLTDGWYGKPDPGLEPHGERPFGRVYRQLIERFGGWSWLQELLQVLAACGVRHDTDIASIALAWTLAQSGAAALLVGIGSAHRPAAYRQAAALVLDQEDIAAIAAVLDRRPAVTGDVGDVERTGLLDTIAASYRPSRLIATNSDHPPGEGRGEPSAWDSSASAEMRAETLRSAAATEPVKSSSRTPRGPIRVIAATMVPE